MRLNTNVASIAAQRSVGKHVKDLQDSSGKLSSGKGVRTASDNAAALAIGNQFKNKERMAAQAIRNTNDAMSEFQVAEGAYNEMSSIVTRLRELSMQAATDTVDDNQRAMIDIEFQQMRTELDRIAAAANYNGKPLLQVGANDPIQDYQVGIYADESSRISYSSRLRVESEGITVDGLKLQINTASLKTKDSARSNLSHIDTALNTLTAQRAYLGSLQSRLTTASDNLLNEKFNSAAAGSRILDTDMAAETANNLKTKLLTQSATGVLSQANKLGLNTLKLIG